MRRFFSANFQLVLLHLRPPRIPPWSPTFLSAYFTLMGRLQRYCPSMARMAASEASKDA